MINAAALGLVPEDEALATPAKKQGSLSLADVIGAPVTDPTAATLQADPNQQMFVSPDSLDSAANWYRPAPSAWDTINGLASSGPQAPPIDRQAAADFRAQQRQVEEENLFKQSVKVAPDQPLYEPFTFDKLANDPRASLPPGSPKRAGYEKELEKQGRLAAANDVRRRKWLENADRGEWSMKDWEEYGKSLPYPMDYATYTDPDLKRKFLLLNDLATGVSTKDWTKDNGKLSADDAARRQGWVDSHRRWMAELGVQDPIEYVLRDEIDDAKKTSFLARLARSAVRGASGAVGSALEGVTDDIQAIKKRGMRDMFRHRVESEANKALPLPGAADMAQAVSETMGQMAPALAAGALTGNAGVTYAIMGSQVGAAEYGQKRAEGWSKEAAFLYGAAAAGVEVGSEMLGQKAANLLGLEAGEQAVAGLARKQAKQAIPSVFEAVPNRTARDVMERIGSATMEGGEELAALVGNDIKDAMFGLQPDQREDPAQTFVIGALAGGVMHVPAFAKFLLDPSNRQAQKEAGIPADTFKDSADAKAAAWLARNLAEDMATDAIDPLAPMAAKEEVQQKFADLPKPTITPRGPTPGQPLTEQEWEESKKVAWRIAEHLGATREQFDSLVYNLQPQTEEEWNTAIRPFREAARKRVELARNRVRNSPEDMGRTASSYDDVRPLPPEQQPGGDQLATPEQIDALRKQGFRGKSLEGLTAGEFNRIAQEGWTPARLRQYRRDNPSQPIPAAQEPIAQEPVAPLPTTAAAAPPSLASQPPVADAPPVVAGQESGAGPVGGTSQESPPSNMPPVKAGMVRFYHGGNDYDGGSRWLTPDYAYAKGYATKDGRTDASVSYVDIPADSPYLKKSFDDEGTDQVAPYTAFDAPPEIASQLKRVDGQSPNLYEGRKKKLTDYDADRGKEFLRDALSRSQNVGGPAEVVKWLEKGFGDQYYWMFLKREGKTLEQYVAENPQLRGMAADNSAVAPAVPTAASPVSPKTMIEASDDVSQHLLGGRSFKTINEARDMIGRLTGQKVKPGTVEAKKVDEAVELGVVKAARQIIRDSNSPEAAYDSLVRLYQRQPNLAVRTGLSMRQQAFSTPAPLAYLAQQLAGVGRDTAVYDSSAGNGMLLTASDKPMANEINEDRVAALRSQGIEATQADATSHRPGSQPEAIVINPPFGEVPNERGRPTVWTADGVRTKNVDHAIVLNTLQDLPENGKAVLIIGSKGFQAGDPKPDAKRANSYLEQKAFYDRVYDQYNVVDHFTVGGDLYARQGAKFPIDVIVIEGRGNSARPRPWQFKSGGLPEVFNSWEGLKDAKLLRGRSGAGTDSPRASQRPQSDVEPVSGGTGRKDSADAGQRGGSSGTPAGNGGPLGGEVAAGGAVPAGSGGTGVPSGDGGNAAGAVGGQSESVPAGGQSAGDRPAGNRPGDVDSAESVDADAIADAMESMFDELEGKKPPAAPPVSKPGKKSALPQKKPRPEGQTSIQKKAADARDEAKKALDDFINGFKDSLGGRLGAFDVNPDHVRRAATAAIAMTKANVYTFAEFIEKVVDAFRGAGATEAFIGDLAPYLEAAWKVAHKRDTTGKVQPAGKFSDVFKPATEEAKQQHEPEKETEFQTAYEPRSKNGAVGTLIPRNHQAAVQNALGAIEEEYGDLDAFVGKELGFSPAMMQKAFSAEQVDAIAMAIANDKRGNRAFVLADQTGVGKGRAVAGMIVYATRQGKIPVFVTEKPTLYADMIRDLTDIGVNTAGKLFTPFITNDTTGDGKIDLHAHQPQLGPRVISSSTAANRKRMSQVADNWAGGRGLKAMEGKNEVEYDAIFTTYDQMRPQGGHDTWRHGEMRRVIGDAYLILDESHNAGGSAKPKQQDEDAVDFHDPKPKGADYFREWAGDAYNVLFSSATFAKRPEVMDLYARAGLGEAVGNIDELPDMVARGGVPLQQVVSEMMVEAGLMLRRERSFAGVEMSPQETAVDLGDADKVASIFRAIHEFDQLRRSGSEDINDDVTEGGGRVGDDNSTGTAGMDSKNFTSILWNLNDQMMLAFKAESAANEAIAAHRRGEAPVIALDNTLGSSLHDYVEQNGHEVGDVVPFSYRDLLRNYLRRSREILVQRDVTDKDSWERVWIEDSELSPEALAAWDAAEKLVDEFDVTLPASPIDWIRKKLQDANLRVGEITGRQLVLDYGDSDGSVATLQHRPKGELGSRGKEATIRKFNGDELDVLIINRSGSTGISLHSSSKFKNAKRRRHMVIAQPAKDINVFMQMLGRVHRTGQISAPKYTLLMTNMPAEKRPGAILLKKLASLNANVTASSKGSVAFDVPDIANQVGNRVAFAWLNDNKHVNMLLGRPAPIDKKHGGLRMIPTVAERLTGRSSMLPVEQQQALWDELTESYEQLINELNQMNANPLTAQNLDMDAKTLERFPVSSGSEDASSPFLQPAYLEKLDAKVTSKSLTSKQVREAVQVFYGIDDLDGLRDAAVKWSQEQRDKLNADAEKFIEARRKDFEKQHADSLKKFDEANKDKADYQEKREAKIAEQEESLGNRLSQFQDQKTAIVQAMWTMPPGSDVEVTRWDVPIRGTVIGFRKNQSSNPIAPSKWYADIALADSMRRVRIPVSQMSGSEATVIPKAHWMANLEEFDESSSVSRRTRYVATGNLLAAYEQFKDVEGKSISFFTDNEGKLRRGMILPESFDPARWEEARPAVFKSADDLLKFLEAGGNASSADQTLLFMKAGGTLYVRAPRSRSKNGKYTTNPAVLKAASPADFVTLSARMELAVPEKGNQKGVLDEIMKLVAIQTRGDKALAERVLGADRVKAMAPGRSNPTRQTTSLKTKNPGDRSTNAVAARDIIKTWERIFAVPIRAGGIAQRRAAGIYKLLTHVVRIKEEYLASLAVASHEIAHHVDNLERITDPKANKLTDALRMELGGLDYQPLGRVDEGFAEFVRRWVTEQNAKDMAPMFHRWWEKWLADNPAWGKKFQEARNQARSFGDQSIFQRINSLIGRAPQDVSRYERWKQRASSKLMQATTAQIDKFAALNLVDKELKGAGWDKRLPGETALHYDMSANAHAANALENGVHSIRTGHKLSDVALWDAQQYIANEEEYDEAVAYALAKHTLFMRQKKPGYNTGLDVDGARRWVQRMKSDGKADRYDKFAKVISGFGDSLLDMMADAGAIPVAQAARLKDYYQGNYFPLYRIEQNQGGMFTGSGFVNLPSAVRGRSSKGSERQIVDPFDAMVNRAIHDYRRAAKARVVHTLIEALDPQLGGVQGFGKFLDRVPPNKKVTHGTVGEILKTLVSQGVVHRDMANAMLIANAIREGRQVSKANLRWFADRHGIDMDDESAMRRAASTEPDLLSTVSLWRLDFTPSAAKRTILYHDRMGNPILYEMDDMLYRVATGLDIQDLGPVLATLRAGSTVFKTGATGISTAFAGVNLVRDYIDYQGRARYVKGFGGTKGSVLQPPIQLARYLWAKGLAKITGKPLSEIDATADFIEKTGGKIYTRLGDDASRKRLRRKNLGGKKGSLLTLPSWKELGANVASAMQEVTAWSDLPPRMAEAEAAIRSYGFEKAGGKWRDGSTGKVVDYLPEHVQIKAGLAAANATINFKRGGTQAAAREAVLPFSRAQVNALYRKVELISNLKHIAETSEEGDMARRLMFYKLALVGVTAGLVLKRLDDDDYQEMPDHEKQDYWTIGYGGVTVFRIPKPQDERLTINLVENMITSWYDADGSSTGVLAGLAEDVKDMLPSGGGALVGLAETYFNYDTFREREIEPSYMAREGVPVEYRSDPYTMKVSKLLSEHLGKYLNLSPLKVQHLLNSVSGGTYARWSDLWESAAVGELDTRHVPFAGRFMPNRHQSESINDFYAIQQQTREDSYREKLDGVEDGPAAVKVRNLDSYAELMAFIRQVEPRDSRGRRSFRYTPWLVGLAREALGRAPQESNPSPFAPGVDPPDIIKSIVGKHAASVVRRGMLSYGRPTSGEDVNRRTEVWNEARKQAQEWLAAHADNPIVAKEIRTAMNSDVYRGLISGRDQPRYRAGMSTAKYQQDVRAYNDRRRAAAEASGLINQQRQKKSALRRKAS